MKVTNGFMQNINTIGSAGMAMMIPMLAGYIAYSLAGKACTGTGDDRGLYSKQSGR